METKQSWRYAALVVLLAAIGAGAWVWFWLARVSPPPPPEVSWEQDEPAVRDALNAAREGILRDPSSGAAWGHFGQVLLAHAHEEEAIPALRQAERLGPANPRWPCLLGGLLRVSQPQAALVLLRQAVERLGAKDAENSAPRLLLAEMLLNEDNLDEAEDHFRRVLERQPKNVGARYGLGLVRYRRGDLAESRQLLLPCADNPYTKRKSCAQLAVICQRLGDLQAAETFDLKAKTPGEDYSWPDPFTDEFRALAVSKRSRFEQADHLEQQGRFQEAVRVYNQLAWDNKDRRALLALGRCLAKMKDWTSAEKALRMGLEQATAGSPDNYRVSGCYFMSFVLFNRGESLHSSGDPQANEVFTEAADWARKALAYKPDHAFAHIFLGLSLQKLGRRHESLAAFRQAAACAPGFIDAHLHLGEALAEEGLGTEADRELREAARLASADDPRPAAALARLQRGNKSASRP